MIDLGIGKVDEGFVPMSATVPLGEGTAVEAELANFWATHESGLRAGSATGFPCSTPQGVYQTWLFEQIVHMTIRIDRWLLVEEVWQTRQARRAGLSWEADRRAEAEVLAQGLAKRPGLVVARLHQTLQGCDWLINAWRGLAEAQRGPSPDAPPRPLGPNERQRGLNLLGVDPDCREGRTPLDPPSTAGGTGPSPRGTRVAAHQAALIANQVAALTDLRDGGLVTLDAEDRTHGPARRRTRHRPHNPRNPPAHGRHRQTAQGAHPRAAIDARSLRPVPDLHPDLMSTSTIMKTTSRCRKRTTHIDTLERPTSRIGPAPAPAEAVAAAAE